MVAVAENCTSSSAWEVAEVAEYASMAIACEQEVVGEGDLPFWTAMISNMVVEELIWWMARTSMRVVEELISSRVRISMLGVEEMALLSV